ncbi:uncharacterized protein A1O9_02102 [Exophiala aquamarina CBS 119918]|uniref:Caib baif family enzyme n=1 Tax=Exophiala aquamarina CBS 119918 TaxID=1182545 RepID=A0A072PKY2_9EURO|nr:uncharacterized protein A1O9_02102 [Exophiala aquamarina CBS 119918]KEF60541.1 hypothetical protein A1O9_02102 [Exophiala aquamarina CBS 119918]
MSPSKTKDELRIVSPIGALGRGFVEEYVWDAIESGIDAIIVDAGSTDSGPGRLALGKMGAPQAGYWREFEILVRACHLHNVKVLIGSAGGSGSNAFVDHHTNIIKSIIKEKGFRPMKVVSIYSEISKEVVREKLKAKLISPCGSGIPDLLEHDIDSTNIIVAQMGLEPYLQAMTDNPDFDIIIGGRAYDPAPFAAFCMYHGFDDLGLNYAMGKIMECGAQCSIPKSKECLAIVRRDNFDLIPLQPGVRCTPTSVAAHLLYEKSRPDILQGPGGALYTSDLTYEQIDSRTVRVRGARFIPEPEGEYTVKLEAARVSGYQTTFVGAFRDPILISQLDSWIPSIEKGVRDINKGFEFDLKIHLYGLNGVMGSLEPDRSIPKEVCLVVHVRAPTQEQANDVATSTKNRLTHAPYAGQLATAGNFAWPLTPSETPMGPCPEFCIYHIMHNSDPVALFPIRVEEYQDEKTSLKPVNPKSVTNTSQPASKAHQKYYLQPEPAAGTCYLADIASVVRSKIAGPYHVTFDVMFTDRDTYEKVKQADVLKKSTISKLYNIPESDIDVSMWWDQAMAFKATIPRHRASGGFGETDTHGSQQHAPLLYLTLPWGRT